MVSRYDLDAVSVGAAGAVVTVEAEVVALIGSLSIQMLKIFVAVEELNLNIKSPTLRDREVDHQWTMEIETEINSSKSFISD